jgi:putative membrane protein
VLSRLHFGKGRLTLFQQQYEETVMHLIANIIVGLVAALHIGFLILEMFLWQTPFGRRTFGLTPEFAAASAKLAANQGLYNGFLAAGLIWGLLAGHESFYIKVFFLTCVIVAGLYGGFTVKKSILMIQALPALIALVLLHL